MLYNGFIHLRNNNIVHMNNVIKLFKIMHGITICDIKNAFVFNPVNVTRGHSYKLVQRF